MKRPVRHFPVPLPFRTPAGLTKWFAVYKGMTAEEIEAIWKQITAVCPGMPNEARPLITSFISVYRRQPEYKQLKWRYDEAAKLAKKTDELTKRIKRYQNDVSVPEPLRPAWKERVEGLDKLVDVLTLWTERFQETEKMGKFELKVFRNPVQALIGYLQIIRGLDRSKEVERLVATVLEIADSGMKKKNIGWQIRRAIEDARRVRKEFGMSDEFFANLERDPRFEESIKRLIPDLEEQKNAGD
jgi:hypothetical protein